MSGAPPRCPACGGDNHCAIAGGRKAVDCWCMQATLRADLPPRSADANAACFCRACASGKEKAPVSAGAFS